VDISKEPLKCFTNKEALYE